MNRDEIEKLLTDAGVAEPKPVLDKIMSINGFDVNKVRAETDALKVKYETLKTETESKQAEIDKAVEEAKKATKTELETQYKSERTAELRKRARTKVYDGLSDEQKSIFDAFVKDEDLKLAEDGETFENWGDVSKPVKEKYKTLFPVEQDGTKSKAGLGVGANADTVPINRTALDIARAAAGLPSKEN